MADNNKSVPPVTPQMYKAVSQYRRDQLEGEVQKGLYRDGTAGNSKGSELSPASYAVSGGSSLQRYAQQAGESASNSFKGSQHNVTLQTPEVYSPLWLTSNLNLPRDRATMNAWCRSFYALNPIVQNAINLHSTYPISKLNIKCPNKKVEKFFSNMIEEIDLMNICSQAAQEYWLLGEAVVYGELDERNAKWSRLHIQNPDYIIIKRSVIASEPVIMLRPDESLRRICMSNLPADIEQRKQLNETIINYVRRGQNIPLDNLYVSHLARRISPYEVRGTGLPVSIFKALMLYDQIKECYHIDTEVLTDQGFKKFTDVIDFQEDQNGNISSTPRQDIKIACFNPDNEHLEYHQATDSIVKNYDGELIHFQGQKVDIKVTPGHNMWVKKKVKRNYKPVYTDWRLQTANEMTSINSWYKFRSHCKWEGRSQDYVNVTGAQIPINDYLKFMGYLISEGTIYTNYTKHPTNVRKNHYDAVIKMPQATTSPCFDDIYDNFHTIASYLGKHVSNRITPPNIELNYQEAWSGTISGKEMVIHFKNELGLKLEERCYSYNKCIPRWILELKPELLTIILESLVNGDAHRSYSTYNDTSNGFQYTTVSKQLADDVFELVYKCGFVPNISIHWSEKYQRNAYIVCWSNTVYGVEPNILTGKIRARGNGGGAQAKRIPYKGKVWCLTVLTGLFITRLNNKITIQGNCKFSQTSDMINPMRIIKIGGGTADYRASPVDLDAWREVWAASTADKNFKIFTHDAITVETIGAGSGIYDTTSDFAQLLKEMYAGLMVPQIIIEGGGDISYANGGISLDVLRQRYMQFRNMMSMWLRKKIFQPIAKLNEFYDYVDGEKTLIIPEIDWNHMSLFDMETYVQNLRDLTGEQKRVSIHTLYRSLGLEWEEERRKIRKEDIADAIRKKEQSSLERMNLNELRTLNEDDEIPEILESPLPGMSPYDDASGGSPSDGGGGMPGLESPPGGLPPPPEAGPSGASSPPAP